MIDRSLRALGCLFVGILIAILTLSHAQAANPFTEARAATRLLSSKAVATTCSAVVIAPEIALTAKHCASIPGLLVDNLPVDGVRAHPSEDVAELTVPGLACPCVKVGAVRPVLDETVLGVGFLYGQIPVTARGEYLGQVVSPEGEHYGLATLNVGPGMSGGGVFRVFVTGEVTLVGIISGMTPHAGLCFYVEVSKDAPTW